MLAHCPSLFLLCHMEANHKKKSNLFIALIVDILPWRCLPACSFVRFDRKCEYLQQAQIPWKNSAFTGKNQRLYLPTIKNFILYISVPNDSFASIGCNGNLNGNTCIHNVWYYRGKDRFHALIVALMIFLHFWYNRKYINGECRKRQIPHVAT